MGILKNEYKSFLDDIEKNIKDPQDLEYIKGRFASFLDVILDQMDYIMDYKKEQIEKLENTQKELDDKMGKMQQVIDNIEKDIYSEDGFDFEIVCPYCNYEFFIDIDENTRLQLLNAGKAINRFIDEACKKYKAQYLLIIEGQASKDNFIRNNELSYERALALVNYWKYNGVFFNPKQCEVIISGSGQDGTLRIQPDVAGNVKNQRFLIHILPKPGVIK